MLGKLTSDALGISDTGRVIQPDNYDKVESDDYVMHEDDEKIFFLIKSKADEYCFTNTSMIHVDGTSAASKKRTLRRYFYRDNKITNVELETAGTLDRDVEIKLQMGNTPLAIDVHKDDMLALKDLYKALIAISETTHHNETLHHFSKQSLDMASATLTQSENKEQQLHQEFNEINQLAYQWLKDSFNTFNPKDFGYVFEKYINN